MVERILDGDEPEGMSFRRLPKGVPVAWSDQTILQRRPASVWNAGRGKRHDHSIQNMPIARLLMPITLRLAGSRCCVFPSVCLRKIRRIHDSRFFRFSGEISA